MPEVPEATAIARKICDHLTPQTHIVRAYRPQREKPAEQGQRSGILYEVTKTGSVVKQPDVATALGWHGDTGPRLVLTCYKSAKSVYLLFLVSSIQALVLQVHPATGAALDTYDNIDTYPCGYYGEHNVCSRMSLVLELTNAKCKYLVLLDCTGHVNIAFWQTHHISWPLSQTPMVCGRKVDRLTVLALPQVLSHLANWGPDMQVANEAWRENLKQKLSELNAKERKIRLPRLLYDKDLFAGNGRKNVSEQLFIIYKEFGPLACWATADDIMLGTFYRNERRFDVDAPIDIITQWLYDSKEFSNFTTATHSFPDEQKFNREFLFCHRTEENDDFTNITYGKTVDTKNTGMRVHKDVCRAVSSIETQETRLTSAANALVWGTDQKSIVEKKDDATRNISCYCKRELAEEYARQLSPDRVSGVHGLDRLPPPERTETVGSPSLKGAKNKAKNDARTVMVKAVSKSATGKAKAARPLASTIRKSSGKGTRATRSTTRAEASNSTTTSELVAATAQAVSQSNEDDAAPAATTTVTAAVQAAKVKAGNLANLVQCIKCRHWVHGDCWNLRPINGEGADFNCLIVDTWEKRNFVCGRTKECNLKNKRKRERHWIARRRADIERGGYGVGVKLPKTKRKKGEVLRREKVIRDLQDAALRQ
eukprot:jgi/Chlat1/1183/Chrsp114S00067